MRRRHPQVGETKLAILELLEETRCVINRGMWLTPAVIATNIDESQSNVRKQILQLHDDFQFVERDPGDGRKGQYRITEKGVAFLEGELDVDDINEDG